MSCHRYSRRRRDGLSSAVDDAAHIAAKFGPVGALLTGAIGYSLFYAALPACMMAWAVERKGDLKGPAAVVFATLLDQVMWHRFIIPCQWGGIAILLVCTSIALWKYFDQVDIDFEGVTFLSAVSKAIGWLIGR